MASHHGEEADARWRHVLFELLKRAKADPEFRTRVEASGAVLDHFEVVLEQVQHKRAAPPGAVACRDYWWGFQLTVPHAMLALWPEDLEPGVIGAAIGTVAGPASPFLRRAAYYVATRLAELKELDQGDGVQISMTWMAPNIFVPIAIR